MIRNTVAALLLILAAGTAYAAQVANPSTAVLNNPANGRGADRVANAVRSFDGVAALRAYPKPALVSGRTLVAQLYGWAAGTQIGGGPVRWDAAETDADDGCRVFNPTGNVGTGRWVRIEGDAWTPDHCGAAGDGVADDTAEVQAAAVAFADRGFMLPRGRIYRVLSTITASGNISGTGTLRVNATNTSALNYGSATDWRVSGIKIESTQTTNLFTGTSAGIVADGAQRFEIDGVEIQYFTDGVSISNAVGVTVRDSAVHELGQECIVIRYSTAWTIRDNDCYRHNGDGILIKGDGEQGGLIEGNTVRDGVNIYGFAGVGGGITANAESGELNPMRGLRIIGNRMRSVVYGVTLIAAVDFNISANRIDSITGTKGISVDNSGIFNVNSLPHGRAIISGNSVTGIADDEGIVMLTTGTITGFPSAITGNYIDLGNVVQNAIRAQNSAVVGNTVNGGLVNLDCQDCAASGNYLLANTGSADSAVKLRGSTSFTGNILGSVSARQPGNIQVAASWRGAATGNTIFANAAQPVFNVIDGAQGIIRSNFIDNAGAGARIARSGGGQLQDTIDTDAATQRGLSQQYGNAAPVSGTWAVGDIVWQSAPAAAGFIGWVCTTGGTPGTWKTFGAVSP